MKRILQHAVTKPLLTVGVNALIAKNDKCKGGCAADRGSCLKGKRLVWQHLLAVCIDLVMIGRAGFQFGELDPV